MPHHIHLHPGFAESQIQAVQAAVGLQATLTSGEAVPPETTVLVAGRPDTQALDAEPLRAVIVPWAGIPPQTLDDIRRRPHLKLYNLHHNNMATAELAVALLLACTRQIPLSDRKMREGVWRGRQGAPHGYLLTGKRAIVFGYGAIGRQIGQTLAALGMEVVGVRRRTTTTELGFENWRDALPSAEVLVVAAPLTDETKGAVGASEIAALAAPRFLVNIARGPIVDERALYEACADGVLAGAGIDVWYRYPQNDEPTFPSEFPFQELDNVVLSPHVGGAGDTAEALRIAALIEVIQSILADANPASVNLEYGY